MSACDVIPIAHLYNSYTSINRRGWLLPCLVVRSIDPTPAQNMLDMFVKKQVKFERLTLFNNKKKKRATSLYAMLR